MVDFGPKVFCPNFQIVISQESLGVRGWNFRNSHISMIPTNGAKMKKFCEVRVSSSKKNGWFDMELQKLLQFTLRNTLLCEWLLKNSLIQIKNSSSYKHFSLLSSFLTSKLTCIVKSLTAIKHILVEVQLKR